MKENSKEKNKFLIIWSVCLVLLFAFVFVGGNSSVTIKGTSADVCSNFLTESACKGNSNNCTWVPDKYESSCNGIYYVSGDAHNCNELGESECLEKANLGYCSWENKKVTKAYCTSSGGDSSGSGGSTCADGSYKTTSGQCELCPAGHYCTGGVKTACPAGTSSSGTGKSSLSTCVSCDAGEFSIAGSSTCAKCAAGTYSGAKAASCTKCPAGKYSTAGSSSCSACADGMVPNASQSACIDSSGDNPNCPNGNATSCPAGKYLYKDAYLCGSCLDCAGDYYCPGGTSSYRTCPEGSSPNADHTACVSDSNDNPNCTGTQPTSCPAGKYLNTDAYLCKSCNSCPSGKVCRGGTSSPATCPTGSVPNASQTACVAEDDSGDTGSCKYPKREDAVTAAIADCDTKNKTYNITTSNGCYLYTCGSCKSGYTQTNGNCVAPSSAPSAGCYDCGGTILWKNKGASLDGCSTTPTTCPSSPGGSGGGGTGGGSGDNGDNSGTSGPAGGSDSSDDSGSSDGTGGNDNTGNTGTSNDNNNQNNVNSNPQTGSIAIFVVGVLCIAMMGYAIYYYGILKKSMM